MTSSWKKLACKPQLLNLRITLSGGQAFRWKRIGNDNDWRGVLSGKVFTVRESEEGISYKVHCHEPNKDINEYVVNNEFILNDYLRLDVDLAELYHEWGKKDAHFKEIALKVPGYRLLRQDPVENLFSFICSSNNNIGRISQMVEALCVRYGEIIVEVDGVVYHSFPTIARLAEPEVEQELRQMKFGYRAKFIYETAKVLKNKNNDWLMSLRSVQYEDVHKALCLLPGVGAKVADCVCLMSLDKTNAIPVDTHVWQISLRDYDIPGLKKSKTLTDKSYKIIGDFFSELFGEHSGWANSVLFSADLKKFQSLKAISMKKQSESDKGKQSVLLKRKPPNSTAKGKNKRKK